VHRHELKAERVLTAALVLTALFTLSPLWVPLLLAAWFADVLAPLVLRLQKMFGGRRRGAVAIVVLFALAVLLPLTGIAIGMVGGVIALIEQLRGASKDKMSIASTILGGSPSPAPALRDWASLLTRYGANAWSAVSTVVQTSSAIAIALVVFIVALYALSMHGARFHAWLILSSPLPASVSRRITGAFRETGRGLLIGTGVTALAQGATATLAYIVLGIPRALILGPLTTLAALVPVFGTGLVWIPLCIGLFVTGHYGRGTALLIVGAGVMSMMDNFLRPALTRYGKLQMPAFLVLLSMLGGVSTFGGFGILLGPLLVRLAIEALSIARDEHAFH
jgi:predicted PurR-regulated permease PerM